MPEPSSDKPHLRRHVRALRDAVDAQARQAAACSAAQHLERIPGWDDVTSLAVYLPHGSELDTAQICARAWRAGKQVYLPVLVPGNRLVFALWQAGDLLTPNRFGIPEPGPDVPRRNADTLDLIFVPLLAWNDRGDRLGMGGGFYDRTLAGNRALKVGVGYELQRCDALVSASWDVSMDFVLTEAALHACA